MYWSMKEENVIGIVNKYKYDYEKPGLFSYCVDGQHQILIHNIT